MRVERFAKESIEGISLAFLRNFSLFFRGNKKIIRKNIATCLSAIRDPFVLLPFFAYNGGKGATIENSR
jgi:hypothetical protein